MGLTIHYEGQLKGEEALEEMLLRVQDFAKNRAWPVEIIDDQHGHLERFANDSLESDEEPTDYDGRVLGVRIHPHPECEPFTLEFDSSLFCQDYTKTQFAGTAVHRALVELLTALQPLFISLEVVDESDYWTERNATLLERSFARANEAIQDARLRYPEGQYKVKTPDGRFIDLIT